MVSSLLLPATPAAAAVTTEPIAIAMGRPGDTRVMHVGGDGRSNSSPIVMAPYVPNSDTNSPRQRWVLERVTGTGMPAFAYRFKNPASGKCVNAAGSTPVNKAAIILYTCNGTLSGTNEIWWMDDSPWPDGVQVRNKRDNRCVDVSGASTAANAPLVNYTCNDSGPWNQLYRPRTGSFDCTVRDRDWQATSGLCVRPQPTSGVMSSWFNVPATMAYRNPSTYVLSNELRSRISADVINAQSSWSGEVQMGWRALRAATSAGSVSYNAYWQELGQNVEEYHALPTVDAVGSPNGSTTADGTQHTYLMLASSTANQWDLFYDFNYVATTARQSGSRADWINAGLQSRYVDALTQSQPYEFRVQSTNVAGVWTKPDLAQTALGSSKECGMFPIWEDFSGGAGNNQPPWCLTTARTLTNAGGTVDTVKISKPTGAVSLAEQHPAATSRPAASGVVNGVDQAQLARCVAEDPTRCLQTVPGLQQCVDQRLLCSASTSAATAGARRSGPAVDEDQAITAARSLIHSTAAAGTKRAAGQPRVTRTTLADAGLPDTAGAGRAPDTAVYAVTGDDARSWAAGSGTRYDRWTAVVDATSGDVLYARLDSPR